MQPNLSYFESFSVELVPAPSGEQRALAEALAARLPGPWRIEPIAWTGEPLATRREVLLSPARDARVEVSAAWEMARGLTSVAGVASVEPLFAAPGLEPSRPHLRTLLTPDEIRARAQRARPASAAARARGVGGGGPLPCAADPQWSLDAMRVTQAWAIAPPSGLRFGQGITIGHIDTGYTDHPELWDPPPAPRRVRTDAGFDFESDDPDARDPLDGSAPGHGTSTASVIMSSQRGPEAKFVSGVAPLAELVPVRVSGGVVHLSFANVVRAIHHCVDRGAHVISMSLGGPVPSDALRRAVHRAVDSGVIVLAAAGNVWPFVVYPARLDEVVAVAATNCEGAPWANSARGEDVDVSAPGESVWRASARRKSGAPVFGVAPSSGTSYAVAGAAGVCALWLAFHGRDALLQRYGAGQLSRVFRRMLKQACAKPPGWDADDYGAGIVDAERLLALPLPAAKVAIPKAAGRRGAPGWVLGLAGSAKARPVIRALARTSPAAGNLAAAELQFRSATSARWRAALDRSAKHPDALRRLADAEASQPLRDGLRAALPKAPLAPRKPKRKPR
jgi:thermitase